MEGAKEDAESWRVFMRHLKARGQRLARLNRGIRADFIFS
jgi:transposase-like protein